MKGKSATGPLNPAGRKHRFGKAWMHEHVTDHWVQEARRLGYRSRAAFKLLEIADKDKLFRPGIRAVDLGAAPGSWSQVLAQKLGRAGRIVAIDLLPMDAIAGVALIRGDFASDEGLAAVEAALDGRNVDLVVSDMAPNLSGIDAVDRARGVHLAELALEFAAAWLEPGGDLAVKMFQGEGFDAYVRQVSGHFRKTYVRKPKASRDRSREVFVVGKGFLGRADEGGTGRNG
ncbi:MAG TPA: RlmE family RNA methyltransferase [Casimicrobiaceae bacterium]|nr:RlmE family RNA methyltransferase [Casimicrobiaceae bacterium]